MDRKAVSDFEQLLTAIRYQLAFYLRTYRFLGLLILVLAISGVVLGLDLHTGSALIVAQDPTASGFLSSYLGNIGLAIIVTAAFLGGDAISIDFGTGSGYLLLVQPVRRRILLFGRYIAAFLATVAVGLAYYLFAVVGTLTFYGASGFPGPAFAASIGLAALFAAAALAVAFLFSSFFRTPAVGMIVTVLALYLGFSVVTGVVQIAGIEPWFSLTYAGQAISGVLDPNFAHETVTHLGRRFTLTSFSPYPWEAIAILVGYWIVAFPLTWAIYERKETRG